MEPGWLWGCPENTSAGIAKNFRDARKFRENYVRINEMEAAVAEIHRYFDSCGETV